MVDKAHDESISNKARSYIVRAIRNDGICIAEREFFTIEEAYEVASVYTEMKQVSLVEILKVITHYILECNDER